MSLTTLGIFHTILSLLAVLAGAVAFFRNRKIDAGNHLGRLYIWLTVLTCLTGFGIFRHGGFSKAHALGVVTLLVLLAVWAARQGKLFGRLSPYAETVAMSTTFFLHMIPGFTETLTRLPAGAPVFDSPESNGLKLVIGCVFVLYLLGVAVQVRAMRAQPELPLSPAQ